MRLETACRQCGAFTGRTHTSARASGCTKTKERPSASWHEVVVNFSHRAYAGKKTGASRKLRVVCIKDDETSEYHAYITNLSPEEFSAEDVASLYRARWEVELVFRELKNEYSIDMIPTKNPDAVKALVWTGILTLIIQRIRFVTMLELYPERAHEMSTSEAPSCSAKRRQA